MSDHLSAVFVDYFNTKDSEEERKYFHVFYNPEYRAHFDDPNWIIVKVPNKDDVADEDQNVYEEALNMLPEEEQQRVNADVNLWNEKHPDPEDFCKNLDDLVSFTCLENANFEMSVAEFGDLTLLPNAADLSLNPTW